MTYVDGNALAGALSLVFGTDVTAAETICGNCDNRHALATMHVYLRCPGMVMRCPSCGTTQVVLTDLQGHLQLQVRSVAAIHL